MPQTKIDVQISDEQKADEIRDKGMDVAGVKYVLVNMGSSVVITHSEEFDENAFKAAVGI